MDSLNNDFLILYYNSPYHGYFFIITSYRCAYNLNDNRVYSTFIYHFKNEICVDDFSFYSLENMVKHVSDLENQFFI